MGLISNFNNDKMAVSIIEALHNAKHNVGNAQRGLYMLLPMAEEQLNNAIILLEKGYGIYDEVEPLLEEYGDAESVPEKE